MGTIAAGVIIILRRGTGFFGTLAGLFGILSGVYYPVSVYPEFAQLVIKIFSPFYHVLMLLRPVMVENRFGMDLLQFTGLFIIPGILFLYPASKFFEFSLHSYKKRGSPLIFTA